MEWQLRQFFHALNISRNAIDEREDRLKLWRESTGRTILSRIGKEVSKELSKRSIEYSWEKLWNLEEADAITEESQWLELEKERPNFKVLALEKEQIITLKNTKIKLRIDRVDENENGGYVLIDYKTGPVSLNGLFDNRLSEPQLPLYNLSFNNDLVVAATFAQVKQEQVKFVGVGELENSILGVKELKSLKLENKIKN